MRAVNTADVAGQWSNVEWAKTRAALQKAGLIPESRHQIHKDEDVEEDVGLGGRGSIGVNWINREFSPCVTFEVQYKGGSITDWTDQTVNIYDHWGNVAVPTFVNITGLADGTWYDLRLRSVTYDDAPCEGGAEGPWSDIVRAPTPQYDKPTIWFGQHGAPYSTERGILKVRWTQPTFWQFQDDPDLSHTEPTRYDMRYRKAGETSWTDELTRYRFNSHTLSGLDDSTTYEFQVRARNSETTTTARNYWLGPWSDVTSATTLGPPGAIGMGAMGQGAQVVIQWECPAVNGASRYDVQYRQQGDDSWSSASHDGVISMGAAPACGANLGRCAVISSLDTSGATYEARVRAVNPVGAGEWSEVASATTRAVPDSPAIESLTASDAKLTVSWDVPADHGAAINDYDVRYRALPNGDWVNHSDDANDTNDGATLETATTREISGLSGGTMYAVQVRAQNSIGESSWSLAVTGNTPAQAGGQAQAFSQSEADDPPASEQPADSPDQSAADPPALIGLFNDAAIANGSTVALDMSRYFSGDDLVYTVEVTTTNLRTGQERTGMLNEIARNKVRGGWNDGVTVLLLSGGNANSQDLTITITATGTDGVSASDSFTLSLVEETPASGPDPAPAPLPTPTPLPTPEPTPTPEPSPEPTSEPTPEPTATPTPEPTSTPTPEPTATQIPEPTATPVPEPTATPTPEPQGPALTDEFDDLTMSDDETVDIDMSGHFSGENLTYEVLVTTTHQRTGQEKTAPLNTVARNKVTGEWNGDVLTLTAGHASSQDLTIEITASNGDGESSGSFTFTLDN